MGAAANSAVCLVKKERKTSPPTATPPRQLRARRATAMDARSRKTNNESTLARSK